MSKYPIIGNTYFKESQGLYIEVIKENLGGCYECCTYEVDENGREINIENVLLTAHDIFTK